MFSNENAVKSTYANLTKNGFTIEVDENHPLYERSLKRTKKNGKVVHEIHFTSLKDVIIKKVRIKENKWKNPAGKELTIRSLQVSTKSLANNESAVLSIPLTSPNCKLLLRRIPHIDLDQPVTLKTYKNEYITLVVYQNGKKVDLMDKEELPNLQVYNKADGSKIYDDSNQLKWLVTNVIDKYFPADAEDHNPHEDLGGQDLSDEDKADVEQYNVDSTNVHDDTEDVDLDTEDDLNEILKSF